MDDKAVAVYVHSEKNMMPIGVVGTAKGGYVHLDDYKAQADELAKLRGQVDAYEHGRISTPYTRAIVDQVTNASTQRYLEVIRLNRSLARHSRSIKYLKSALAQAVAERDGVRVDAERYRWLRDEAWSCDRIHKRTPRAGTFDIMRKFTDLAEEALDAAIDAARDAGGREGERG